MHRIRTLRAALAAAAIAGSVYTAPAFGQDAAGTAPAESAPRPPRCDSVAWLNGNGLSGTVAAAARAAEAAGRTPFRAGLLRRASSAGSVPVCVEGAGPASPWAPLLDALPAAPVDRHAAGPALRLRPVRGEAVYNSAYPRDRNNGALWAGAGASTAWTGGVSARWGPVSAAIQPVLTFQQNGDFRTLETAGGEARFANPHNAGIDWPQRFGTDPFWTVDPGQSFVRVDAFGVGAGVSTENLWWGPSLRNPILFSNTAPGFPHAFLGTSRPLDVGIGRVEAEAVWGRLEPSDYARDGVDDDGSLLTGFGIVLHPRALTGLSVGVASVNVTTTAGGQNVFSSLGLFGGGNPGGNSLASVFARWILPDDALALHLELGRDDAWEDLTDLVTDPEHSLAYTVGLEKGFPLDAAWLHLFAEATHLQASQSFRSGRTMPAFYTHGKVRQGYSHRGQLLGAAIGPGSNAQTVGGDLYARWGRVGVTVERVAHDNDTYLTRILRRDLAGDDDGRDIEYAIEVRHTLPLASLRVEWALSYAHRPDRDFIELLSRDDARPAASNLGLSVGAAWTPPPLR